MGIHVRFREFLKCRRQCARLENRLFDWAWIKSCWRPIKYYRTVKRGKRKGWIQVELFVPRGRKVIVPKCHVHYKETIAAYEAN